MSLSDVEKMRSFVCLPSNLSLRTFTRNDADEVSTFITTNNPDAYFHAGLLDTEYYNGLYWFDSKNGKWMLVATAGIHVVNFETRTAAIGNVVVDSRHRSQGHGRLATAILSERLVLDGIEKIGLNVKETNIAAIKCYEKLGFTYNCSFFETEMQKKGMSSK
jgi:ribosomal protein S18 acetylase RimI-like enzyme